MTDDSIAVRDVLPSQPVGMVLKKLNTAEQNLTCTNKQNDTVT